MRYRKRPKRRNIGAPVEAPSSAYPAAHTADNYDQHDAPTPSAEHPSRAIHNNAHRPAQDRRMRGIDSREDYPRTDFIGSGLHECGHIFAFELKSKNPEAYTELADAVEDEGRSESEAIADAFVGIALALSEEDPKALADFPACAELAAPGVIRPVTIPRSKFMSELAASQDAVGCIETATTRCEEHQTGPIRSLNTGIGYQLGKGLLVEDEDEHDADELLDGGDSDELLDGGDDDGQDGFGSQWEWQAA